ncbi:MAG TPA: lysylphosphatidylglycerol synthase transmembrane domain-containing protein [Gaiellaceae bacterium]|nr:lysylphosphatidylglycerol synthase transmembrane domain-containing protein [Gaiellaceae bacterium]
MRSSRRAILRFALGVALAAAVFVEIVPRIASYGDVAHRLGTISWPWIVALAAGSLLDIVTTALPWQAVLPQLSFPGALAFTQASTALTTLLPGGAPLGMALSFGFLRRLRIDRGHAAFAVAVTGIWSQVMILIYPLVGAILVFATGELSSSTLAIAGVSAAAGALIVGLTVAALRSAGAAQWLGDISARIAAWVTQLFRRSPPNWSGEGLVRLRAERLVLLRRRWGRLTAATLANQLTAFLVFELSLYAVGISFGNLPPSEAFLAWAIGRVISSLPLTPGGIGVVELGMIGTLVGFGASNAHVVAAVLLYRGVIVLPTLVIGLLAIPWIRRFARAPAEPS